MINKYLPCIPMYYTTLSSCQYYIVLEQFVLDLSQVKNFMIIDFIFSIYVVTCTAVWKFVGCKMKNLQVYARLVSFSSV